MRRSMIISLVGIIGIAFGAFAYTLISGNHPLLGLDLQGGASVVLKPQHPVDSGILDQAISIIRKRVDALGVAEPDISRQGDNVVIQLPGVKDPESALNTVGKTAQLYFRPVLGTAPAGTPVTPASQVDPTQPAVLPLVDAKGNPTGTVYQLGPAVLDGTVVHTANAEAPTGGGYWDVGLTFTGSGSGKWDDMAAKYVNQQIAIVLDNQVVSAPTIQTSHFGGRASITGNFSQHDADNLALVLRYGSLPVQLQPQAIQNVSATLGTNSLRAGVIAGIVGMFFVLLYMIFYYRALGLVVFFGLCLSGMLLWSIISALGQSSGLALSLAGATGIIVAIGITADSYIVYFERLKDEIRSGKSIRSSVDRSFKRAYRTILAADFVSFCAAAILWWFTVGSVRGFAFFLGLMTLLDLLTAFFFTRPAVYLLGRSRFFTDAPVFGIARGLAAEPVGAPA
jgi:preprotein translocase subunit SecD